MNDHADTQHAVYLRRIDQRLRAEFTWNERKALDAAIAALEAGRSGEAEFLHEMLCTRFSEFPKVLDPDASNTTEAVYWAIGEFLERQRPQQPPPVGVTLPARMEPPKEGYRDTSAHEALAHLSTTLADWLPEPDAAEADLATVVAYVQKLEAALREQPAPAGDGECNCHRHGKAEFCPLHTQADYDSDTAAGRSGEARELLARQYEQADPDYAEVIRAGEPLEEDDMRALRAIEAAAPQQPPPVGGWSVATIPIGMAEGADRFRVEMKRGNQYFHVGPTSFVDREDADLYAGILRRALSHQQPAPSEDSAVIERPGEPYRPVDLRMHALLEWNRAQPEPPISIGQEYGVAAAYDAILAVEAANSDCLPPLPEDWQGPADRPLYTIEQMRAYAIEARRLTATGQGDDHDAQ